MDADKDGFNIWLHSEYRRSSVVLKISESGNDVVRTGDGAALPFSFAWNYVINFVNTLLVEGFGHLDPAASSGLDSRLGTCRLNPSTAHYLAHTLLRLQDVVARTTISIP